MINKLDLIIDKIDNLKEVHAERLSAIDTNLAEHMKRTALLEDRVIVLEEPAKVVKYLKSALITIGAVATITYTILKLLPFLQ